LVKFKDSLVLIAAVFGSWISGAGAAQLVDVTFPGEPVVSTSSNSPGSEGVANAIDDELVHTLAGHWRKLKPNSLEHLASGALTFQRTLI